MKFLFLIQSRRGASSRYRVLQFVPLLEAAGVEAAVAPMPNGWWERRRLLGSAGEYDLVFVQKRMLDPLLLGTLRRRVRRLVFDVDDAVMVKPQGGRPSRRRRGRFEAMVRAADLVIAGNSYLADAAASCGGNALVMPTVLDVERYPDAPNWPESDRFTLGWIGSKSTLPYLEQIAPAIDALAAELPQLQLKIVCDDFFDLDRVPVIKKPWASDEEAADLQSIDAGLMPLPHDAWTRGKCGLKILQYFAAHRPAICSPVGVNADIVTQGQTGLFASTPEEWQAAVRKLAQSPELARTMGAKARRRVDEAFSLQALGRQWVDMLLDAAK